MDFLGSNGSLYVLSTAWAVESFTINMSIFDMIPNMKSLEIQHKMVTIDTLPCFKLVYPVIVEIDSVIYVIAASFYGVPNTNVPPLVFKSYNLGNNEWTDLDLPPFMSDPKLYPRFRISYVVVEDKLCISNFAFSCAFDTKTGEWGACNLFKGLIQFDKIAVPRAIMQDVKKCCGPPFPFKKQGLVLFNKFLIYTDRCYDVVARKIDKYGKLSKDCQTLFDGNHVELSGTDNNSMFVGLGEGSFCLLTHVPYNQYNDQTSELRFFKFKVSMNGNGESLTFNHDDVQISIFTPSQGETWQEVFSFFAC